MADKTGIEWTDATWNPVLGCTPVSDGCDLCYAGRETSGRLRNLPLYQGLAEGGRFNGKIKLVPERLDQPVRWRRPRRVFVNSMSDLFHDEVPDGFIARVFAVMALAPQHTFQVLTKRPGRMASLLREDAYRLLEAAQDEDTARVLYEAMWPLPNVWLGTSVEDQRWADVRTPKLLDTPAAVRFLSCEPLLGPIDLTGWRPGPGRFCYRHSSWFCQAGQGKCETSVAPVDWVIVGGESDPGGHARPMHPQWARNLRNQCADAGVPFLFKQHGEWIGGTRYDAADEMFVPASDDGNGNPGPWTWPGDDHPRAHLWPDGTAAIRVGKKAAGRVLDGRTWDEYPS